MLIHISFESAYSHDMFQALDNFMHEMNYSAETIWTSVIADIDVKSRSSCSWTCRITIQSADPIDKHVTKVIENVYNNHAICYVHAQVLCSDGEEKTIYKGYRGE